MSEPIISPWLIYLINLAEDLKIVSFIIAALTVFVFVTSAPEPFISEDERKRRAKKRMIVAITFVVFGTLSLLIPAQNVVYKMIAAAYITPANLEYGEGKAFQIIERCVEVINKEGER